MGFSSAAGLVEAGYKGNSVETLVKSLLDRANGDPKKAEKGIVFIDEIDKIKRGDTGGTRDVSGEGVQNALLTLLDGRKSEGMEGMGHAGLDTGRLLFICTGAFVGLREIVANRLGLGRHTIGFQERPGENPGAIPDQAVYEALCQAETQDLVAYGLIPEFVGRFATVTVLHGLAKADLRGIMGAVQDSARDRQKRLAALHGIELVFTSEALDAIAQEAEALGTGARGLARLIGRAVDAVDHRWPELAEEGITHVTVSRETVEQGTEPACGKGERTLPREDETIRRQCLSGLPARPAPIMRSHSPLPQHITDTTGWTEERLWNQLEMIKTKHLQWTETTGSAREWWAAFEKENHHRAALIYRLAEELQHRQATITDFFMAFIYSNTDNIEANLHYLDYTRLRARG